MISSSYQAITQKRRCFSLMLFYSAASSFFVYLTVSADEVEQENKKRVSHNILVLLLFLYLSNRKLQLFIGKLQYCTLYNFYLQILQDILLSFAVVVISALSPSPSSPYRLVFFFSFLLLYFIPQLGLILKTHLFECYLLHTESVYLLCLFPKIPFITQLSPCFS